MINTIINDIGSEKVTKKDIFIENLYSYINGDKLEFIIKDFWNYRNKTKKNIEKNHIKLFKQLSFFFLLLQDINNFTEMFFDKYPNKDKIKYRINVCLKLYNKALQTFIDSFGLLENGSIGNTYLLWRSIYENYVIALYLINGPEEEAELFNDYAIIQENKLFNKKPTKEEKEKYVNKFGKNYGNDYCWAKRIKGIKTFKNIIEYVKEKEFYPFYILSTFIGHSSSFSLNKGIFSQDRISNIQMIGFYPDQVVKTINTYISLLTVFSKLILNNFVDEENREIIEKLIDYFGVEIDKNKGWNSNFYFA